MVEYQTPPQRILIASSHPLFAEGLRSLIEKHSPGKFQVLGLVSNTGEAFQVMTSIEPDLLIVDFDDDHLNQVDFLQHFIHLRSEIRIVLLSLKEGQEGSEAVVYDRRTTAAAEIEDWLKIESIDSTDRRGELE